MNKIFKVIYSKVRNCYVVTSEFAKANTKSSTGSAKQTAKKSLLSLAIAMGIACGGFVNVGADGTVVEVAIKDSAGSYAQVYTQDGTELYVETKLNDYAKTSDVATNRSNIHDLKIKAESTGATLIDLSGRMTTAESDIDNLQADVATAKSDINDLKTKDTELSGKIGVNKAAIDQNKVDITQNKNDIPTNQNAIDDLKKKVGTVNNGTYLDSSKSVGENLNKLNDGLVQEVADRKAADNALSGRIDTELRNTNAALQEEGKARAEADAKINTKIGNIDDTRTAYVKDANSISQNLTKLDEKLQDTNDRTGGIKRNAEDTQTTIEGIVKVDNQGNIKDVKKLGAETITTTGDATISGDLNVTGDTSLKNTKVDGTLETTGKATFDDDVTMKKDLTVKGKLNVGEISMKNDNLDANGDKHDSATTITADGISNIASIENNGTTTKSQFSHNEKGTFNSASKGDSTDGKEATSNVTADGVENVAKDSKGNNNTFTQTSTDTKNTLTDKDGNTSTTRQDGKGIYGYAKDKDGNKSYTKQEGNRIAESVIGQDGKETKSEMTSTDITNTAKDGTITNDAKDIVNKASGDMTNTVGGNLKNEVTGDIENSATNITNTTTGDMTNTIGGKLTTTVTGATKEEYKGGLTTDVTGEENHIVTGNQNNKVTGKQTNTVEGGQENNISGGQTNTITGGQINNITGDQITNVSGTQTTTATDINRNASSGMIDTVDNAYGTNKETKVAGKTTTEVSIKGTGEKAEYIRGANEAKDELSKGTLKNSETKTVGATSTEITDGTNTSATIQDKTQISGSVTHGTSSAVSNVKADSIDTAVKEGANTSLISQKKNSITSAVGNGTTSTVIQQGDKDITIASNGGTVGIAGKDIINNATYEITNTAGTKITDQVGTNTRVLDNEGITDTVGNTSFKQRIDDIMMEAKNGTIASDAKNITNKATEKISNEAAEIANKASGTISNDAAEIKNTAGKLISNKVGENTYQNIENGKITESIKDGIKQNLTQSDADKTEHSVVNGENATVNKQTSEELTGAVTNGSSSNVIQNTAISSNNTIADWDAAGKPTKANSVISTVDGTTFSNTEANTVLTAKKDLGKDFTNTTIKGNTITTGQATMDYADVMKDLGVRGNANIQGKTTTGSLEVTGTSTLKGDVTMESNATVKKDLTVEGTTTTKDLHVTNNATITGDVTANSYKVGNNTYIDANGINANNQKVTNVADGTIAEGSMDAVNGGQLFETNRRIDQFDSRINEVGANAAAMANLHPMEFDADSKLNVAVGVGNYRNKTATAMGLFYRPNEDVMFNVSSTIGSSDNMIGGGVSFRLGSGGNKLKNKAFADAAEQNKQLKSQVDTLQAQMDALLSVINPNMSKDFPDVPDNHWAYEAVSRLAGNDIIQGYEDGKYHGERTMTRYEMAVIIYKALQKGIKAEAKLVEEFKPELKAIAAHEKA